MADCLACDLTQGRRPLPGGCLFSSHHWVVEHCVGPLNLGTLIVKPRRHVTAVAQLSEDEVAELGPLLRRASAVAAELVAADQVYNCLWSHAGKEPGHIHYVIQPVTKVLMEATEKHGPALQAQLFAEGQLPTGDEIERVAGQARALFAATA